MYIMSTKANQQSASDNIQPTQPRTKCQELIKLFFDAHDCPDAVQRQLDHVIGSLMESRTFEEQAANEKADQIFTLLDIKAFLIKAAILNNSMKGGANAPH